jgi:hypothetical protein
MEKTENDRDKPPLFSSWSRLYAVVLLNLALQVFLFYLLTKVFQ